MKKKYLFLVSILIILAFSLSGCFFGTDDKTVESTDMYELTIEIEGQGLVRDLKEGVHEFEDGAIVDLKAKAKDGWQFKRWVGPVSEKYERKTSVHMNSNQHVVAVFEEKEIDDPSPAYFDVEIKDTNSPIIEGETLEVEAKIKNTGDEKDSQKIKLLIDGEKKDYSKISLSRNESKAVTFSWNTEKSDEGSYEAKITSEDDSDTISVTVNEKTKPTEPEITGMKIDQISNLKYFFKVEFLGEFDSFSWAIYDESDNEIKTSSKDSFYYTFDESYRGQEITVNVSGSWDSDSEFDSYSKTFTIPEEDVDYDLGLSLERTDDLSILEYEFIGTSNPKVHFFDFYVDGDHVGGDGSSESPVSEVSITYEFDSSMEGETIEVKMDVLDIDNNVVGIKTKEFALGEIDEPDPDPDPEITDIEYSRTDLNYDFEVVYEGDFDSFEWLIEINDETITKDGESVSHEFKLSQMGKDATIEVTGFKDDLERSKSISLTVPTLNFNPQIEIDHLGGREYDFSAISDYEPDEYRWTLAVDTSYEDEVFGKNVSSYEFDEGLAGEEITVRLEVLDEKGDVIDSTTEILTVFEDDPDEEVYFEYERLSEGEYKFIASEPEGATYWEWKFPGESFWQGYKGKNDITFDLSDYLGEEVTVKLEIYDADENRIGERYEKTFTVE